MSDESRLIVSEPLRDLPGAWNMVPESSYGVVQAGADELHPFTPQVPVRVDRGRELPLERSRRMPPRFPPGADALSR